MSARAYCAELREQLRTSTPATIGMLLYKIPWLISLRYVGQIGARELAAAALATTLCNVTGMSLGVGLSSAMTTLSGQARGDLIRQGKEMRLAKGEVGNGLFTDEEKKSSNADDGIVGRRLRVSEVGEERDPLLQRGSGAKSEQGSNQTISAAKQVKLARRENDDSGWLVPRQPSTTEPPLLIMTYLYRGIFIQLLLVIPVGLWWLWGVKPALLALGQEESLSTMTEQYLRILTPGLWSFSINWTLTAWLQSVEMADIPAYAAAVGLLFHVPCNILFIRVLGLGYLGAGLATVTFQLIQPIMTFVYLFGTTSGMSYMLESTGAKSIGRHSFNFRSDAGAAIGSVAGICQYCRLALPGIIVISEWWASETCIFMAGLLQPYPEFAVAGMSIYQSINSSCFMLPVGMSVAGSTRVSNTLGGNDSQGAALASKVNILAAGTLSTTMGSILYFTPHAFFPSIFTPNEDVILVTSQTIPLLSLYVIADGLQIAFNGIIKGCGRQCITMPIVIVAYWLVGVPLAYYLAFVKNHGYMCNNGFLCGILGLVGGLTLGTWIHMLLLAGTVMCTTDWQIEAKKAQARLSLEQEKREGTLNVSLNDWQDISVGSIMNI